MNQDGITADCSTTADELKEPGRVAYEAWLGRSPSGGCRKWENRGSYIKQKWARVERAAFDYYSPGELIALRLQLKAARDLANFYIAEKNKQGSENHATAKEPIGITLRDYFAAKAMQGYLAAGGIGSIGKRSYAMADEMLRAREVNPS